jgi:hypothetical protein
MNNWILLAHHNPALDPRLGWITDYTPKNINIKIIAFHHDDKENRVTNNGKERKLIKGNEVNEIISFIDDLFDTLIVQRRLSENKMYAEKHFARHIVRLIRLFALEIADGGEKKFVKLKDEASFILLCNHALIQEAKNEKEIPAGIIASDFYTLLAGVYLKLLWNRPLLYEAHEYHSEETPHMHNKTKKFLKELEKSFCKITDKRFIVTKELAQIAKKEFGLSFSEMMNAVPYSRLT